MVEECLWEVTCQTFSEQVLPRVQQPLQMTLDQVHGCLWIKSEDGRLVADKGSLKKEKWIVWPQGDWNGYFSVLGES